MNKSDEPKSTGGTPKSGSEIRSGSEVKSGSEVRDFYTEEFVRLASLTKILENDKKRTKSKIR